MKAFNNKYLAAFLTVLLLNIWIDASGEQISNATDQIKKVLADTLQLKNPLVEVDADGVAVSFQPGEVESVVVRTQMEMSMLAAAHFAPWTNTITVGLHSTGIPTGYISMKTKDVQAFSKNMIDINEFRSRWEVVNFPPLVSETWEMLWPVIYADEHFQEAYLTSCTSEELLKKFSMQSPKDFNGMVSSAFMETISPQMLVGVMDFEDIETARNVALQLKKITVHLDVQIVRSAHFIYLVSGNAALAEKALDAINPQDLKVPETELEVPSGKKVVESLLLSYDFTKEPVGNSVRDISGNGYAGETHECVWNEDKGLFFNGDDAYVKVIGGENLHSERALTIIGEFIPVSFVGKNLQCLVWKGNIPDCTTKCENREFSLWLSNNGYIHATSTSRNGIGKGQVFLDTPDGSVTGRFVVAMVIDSNDETMKIFLDGNQIVSGPYSGSGLRNTNGPLLIGGGESIHKSEQFKGYMRWLRIYDRALNKKEIIKLSGERQSDNKNADDFPSYGLLSQGKINRLVLMKSDGPGSENNSNNIFHYADNQIYVRFSHHNFRPGTILHGSWFDIGRKLHLGDYPVVIMSADGDSGFVIQRPVEGWTKGKYSVELKSGDNMLGRIDFIIEK